MTLRAYRPHHPASGRSVVDPASARSAHLGRGHEVTRGPEGLPVRRVLAITRQAWVLQPKWQNAVGQNAVGQNDAGRLVVRGAASSDLAAVAAMHGRCSAANLLQRYRAGGRAPSLPLLAAMLREPLVLVVLSGPGRVVALARARLTPDPRCDWTTEMGLVVEDGWQGRGVGSALAAHLAATLRCLGYAQVSVLSATSSLPLLEVMTRIGTTRSSSTAGVTTLRSRLQVPVAEGWRGGSLLPG